MLAYKSLGFCIKIKQAHLSCNTTEAHMGINFQGLQNEVKANTMIVNLNLNI